MDNIISIYKNKEHLTKKATKFLIYSGHDYIIAAVQLYLNEAFGIPCSYPGFAANQFFELHKEDGIDDNKLNENNFHIEYYFNGNLLLNISYPKFKKKVSKLMWSMDQIIDFCKVEKYSFLDYLLYCVLSFSFISISIAMFKENNEGKKKINKYLSTKNYPKDI